MTKKGWNYKTYINLYKQGCENADKKFTVEDQAIVCGSLAQAYREGEILPYDMEKSFFTIKRRAI